MADRGLACGVLWPHLEQCVDEGAGLEVRAPEPFVEGVEDRQQLRFRRRAAASGFGFDPAYGPALLAPLEEGQDEVVLGREVAVEGPLGDPCALDHLVDPDIPDASAGKQLVGRIEEALARSGPCRRSRCRRYGHAGQGTWRSARRTTGVAGAAPPPNPGCPIRPLMPVCEPIAAG